MNLAAPHNSSPGHPFDALADAQMDAHLDAHFNAPAGPLAPSSGFVLSVMDAIHQQAAAPPPIPFPWRRALPGLVALVGTLIGFAIIAAGAHSAALAPRILLPGPLSPAALRFLWSAIGALTSLAVVAASFRLTRRTR